MYIRGMAAETTEVQAPAKWRRALMVIFNSKVEKDYWLGYARQIGGYEKSGLNGLIRDLLLKHREAAIAEGKSVVEMPV